jgi:16S rRNA (uracil1498-N3)-methyltransferase
VRLTRVFCDLPLEAGSDLELPDDVSQHVARVLRLRPGQSLVLFDGSGYDFGADISAITRGHVRVRVLDRRRGIAASTLAITLVQAVSRADRMDLTLQKATELGVHAIAPVFTTRSVVRLEGDQAQRKLRHWRSIVMSACEQSGRSVVPEVRAPVALATYLAALRADGRRIVLDPDGRVALAQLQHPGPALELLIGPEGGLDAEELEAAGRAGFERVHVGPRVLRTETAGLAALAVLQAVWGDLRQLHAR